MKYKNISGFKQLLIIAGKKELINNGLIVEVDRELVNSAFERVDDKEVTTFTGSRVIKKLIKPDQVAELQQKISNLETESAATAQVISDNLKETLDKILPSKDHSNDIDSIINELKLVKEFIATQDGINKAVLKRLEILKSVAMSHEYQIESLIGEETDTTGDNKETFSG